MVDVTEICCEHARLELALGAFPASDPGQFLQVLCADDDVSSGSHDSSRHPRAFLRRPFSIADRWEDEAGQTHLVIISRRVGTGTRWLERKQSGETLNITGPLGHGFDIPAKDVPVVIVGGGVGIPPLLYLARRLHEAGHRDVTAIFGATARDLLPLRLTGEPTSDGVPCRCVDLPGNAPYPVAVTTDDGSLGFAGIVTHVLDRHRAREGSTVFACGPEPMLQAVATWTRSHGLSCQLCIERTMGCGMGTCLSCVVRVADVDRLQGWRWALACSDGPVFERDILLDFGVEARP